MMDEIEYDKHIEYYLYKIEKAIEIDDKLGCKGIDISLDTEDFCYMNNDMINDIVIILTDKYKNVKYHYDERADRLGYCSKHLSIKW